MGGAIGSSHGIVPSSSSESNLSSGLEPDLNDSDNGNVLPDPGMNDLEFEFLSFLYSFFIYFSQTSFPMLPATRKRLVDRNLINLHIKTKVVRVRIILPSESKR